MELSYTFSETIVHMGRALFNWASDHDIAGFSINEVRNFDK